MALETLREVLMPFNAKELEHFNEATAHCTDEQRLAVAKLMSEAKLPEGWQFTEAQIKRFVAAQQINWYPCIKRSGRMDKSEQLENMQERQYKAYRAMGYSKELAESMSGYEKKKHKQSSAEVGATATMTEAERTEDLIHRQYKAYRAIGMSKEIAESMSGYKKKRS